MTDSRYFPVINGGEQKGEHKRDAGTWAGNRAHRGNDFEVRGKFEDKLQPHNFSFILDPAKEDLIYSTT